MPVLVPQLQRGNLAAYLRDQIVTDRELRRQFLLAAEDAERRVEVLRARGGFGNQVRAGQLTVTRIELSKIADEVMRGPVERAIEAGIKRASETGGVSFFKVLGVLERGLGKIPGLREAIIVQARRGAANLISRGMNNIPLSQQIYRTSVLSKGQLYRTLNSHVAAGSSWSELAKDVRRFFSPTVPGGASSAAKRLARTELNNAFHTTQIRTTLKNPFVEGYQWMLSGSHPKPDQCNIYAEENGGIFAKEDVPGKPHPNCLCFLLYVTPSVEDFQNRFLAGKYDRWLDGFIEENVPHLANSATKAIAGRRW